MSLELRSARTLSVGERAELFTAAYEGYVVPMLIDEASLAWMQEKFDFDLDASRIAYRDGEPVGLANLAVRGQDAWIGGVGVVASARRAGVGEALMRAVHEEARSRGVERVWLEVIVENTGAFALYEKLGYELVQDVEVWTLPAAEGEHAGREVPAAEAKAQLPERHEPWQRADGTLVPLRRRARDSSRRAARCSSACARARSCSSTPASPSHCSGRSARSGTSTCSTSPQTTRRRRSSVSSAARSVVRQHEMLLELGEH